jgi:CDP-diacylglycerol--glycerol-3-phosphate 3-phosphatidyltransferase
MPEQRKTSQYLTPANIVTTVRIALIPVFVFVILAPWPLWIADLEASQAVSGFKPLIAAAVFALLALTDSLDGYLARSRNEVTTLGKFLDPLADKILITSALLALTELGQLPAWIALVIIAREFLVSGLRMVASAEGTVIAASPLGKLKTVFQIFAVLLFIVKAMPLLQQLGEGYYAVLYWFSWTVMGVAVILTLLSLADYFFKSAKVLGLPLSGPGRAGEESESGGAAAATKPGVDADAGAAAATKPSAAADAGAAEDEGIADAHGCAASPGLGEERKPSEAPYSAQASEFNEASATAAIELVSLARAKGISLGTAESCTGGLVAATITDIPGASDVFKGGIVSYANEVKEERLHVPQEVLAEHGAVSKQTALAMAQGACKVLDVDIAVSITGIAGPGGGSIEKPVGTVWFAIAAKQADDSIAASAEPRLFKGDRAAIRSQAVATALHLLQEATTGHA